MAAVPHRPLVAASPVAARGHRSSHRATRLVGGRRGCPPSRAQSFQRRQPASSMRAVRRHPAAHNNKEMPPHGGNYTLPPCPHGGILTLPPCGGMCAVMAGTMGRQRTAVALAHCLKSSTAPRQIGQSHPSSASGVGYTASVSSDRQPDTNCLTHVLCHPPGYCWRQ